MLRSLVGSEMCIRDRVIVHGYAGPNDEKNTKNTFILRMRTLTIQKRAQSLIYSCPVSILCVVVSNRICTVNESGRVCMYVSCPLDSCPFWTGWLTMALRLRPLRTSPLHFQQALQVVSSIIYAALCSHRANSHKIAEGNRFTLWVFSPFSVWGLYLLHFEPND